MGAAGWALALTILLAPSATAMAQDLDEPGGAASRAGAARALFDEGLRLVQTEQWPEAAERFARAHRLRPSPVIAYNLAFALEHTTRLVEAAELLRAVVRDPSARPDIVQTSRDLLARINTRLARLTITVTGDPSGVSLAIDGRALPAEMLGVAVPIDPGSHRIEARRGEVVVATQEVSVPEGQAGEASLDLPAAPPPDLSDDTPATVATPREAARTVARPRPRADRDPGDDEGGASPWPWIGLGGAVAVAATVVVVILVTSAEPDPAAGSLGVIGVGE